MIKMLYIIGFTSKGVKFGQKIKEKLDFSSRLFSNGGQDTEIGEKIVGTLEQWTGDAFLNADAILFVGACGIAVRSIAPFLKDKWHDPAVLVIDEKGQHCISLLCGHAGGGNDWCRKIAEIAGAVPVITTATDVEGKFAVDVFAKKNEFQIKEPSLAKEISAAILAGKKIPLVVEEGLFTQEAKEEAGKKMIGKLEETGVSFCWEYQLDSMDFPSERGPGGKLGIYVGIRMRELPFEKVLHLIPKSLVLGLGCRKGVSRETLERRVEAFCREKKLFFEAFFMASTIDIKREEPALLEFCEKAGLSLASYPAEELCLLKGDFTKSSFVEQTTGVDNVCERSALALALERGGEAVVLEKKYSGAGVTAAAALMQREELIWDRYL